VIEPREENTNLADRVIFNTKGRIVYRETSENSYDNGDQSIEDIIEERLKHADATQVLNSAKIQLQAKRNAALIEVAQMRQVNLALKADLDATKQRVTQLEEQVQQNAKAISNQPINQ
jgi:ABC-type multidrug transport system ATPase subunit